MDISQRVCISFQPSQVLLDQVLTSAIHHFLPGHEHFKGPCPSFEPDWLIFHLLWKQAGCAIAEAFSCVLCLAGDYQVISRDQAVCLKDGNGVALRASDVRNKFIGRLQGVLLRRTKQTMLDGEPVVKLPPREVTVVRQQFSKEERKLYDEMLEENQKKFEVRNLNLADVLLGWLCL